MNRLTSTTATKKIFLMLAVAVGVLLVGLSMFIQNQFITKGGPPLNGLLTDLMFEGGVALWGAAFTVYMLEILMHRQEILNRHYRQKVLSRIRAMEEKTNE